MSSNGTLVMNEDRASVTPAYMCIALCHIACAGVQDAAGTQHSEIISQGTSMEPRTAGAQPGDDVRDDVWFWGVIPTRHEACVLGGQTTSRVARTLANSGRG